MNLSIPIIYPFIYSILGLVFCAKHAINTLPGMWGGFKQLRVTAGDQSMKRHIYGGMILGAVRT